MGSSKMDSSLYWEGEKRRQENHFPHSLPLGYQPQPMKKISASTLAIGDLLNTCHYRSH